MNAPRSGITARHAVSRAADRLGSATLTHEAERTAGTRITPGRSYGFFTDTTLCIGCKACEVACKQWNQLPAEPPELTGMSYDNTRAFSATTWRHVRFVEQMDADRFGSRDEERRIRAEAIRKAEERGELSTGREDRDVEVRGRQQLRRDEPGGGELTSPVWAREHMPAAFEPWGNITSSEEWSDPLSRWLLMSDVCKHCVHAPCMEACPTGSIIRTEFDSVYVQQDVCNGCGYCQSACPFGVIEVDDERDGKAHKCTLCYDRLKDGLEPACAKSCPTDSIQFGPVDELLERAQVRVAELRDRGIPAYLYGSGDVLEDAADTSELGGLNCFFLLVDRPEIYNLPPVARRPSDNAMRGLLTGLLTAAGLALATMVAFRDRRR